jgi:FtsZ-interacting cell division protein ZipA
MELLESQDPEKKRLIEASARHKKALEKEVADLSNKTEKVLTNALIIGGALALSYILVRQFSGSKKKKKKHKKARKVTVVQPAVSTDEDDDDEEEVSVSSPGMLADIGTQIANQATVILVDLARQKLMEYLESRKKTDEAS